MATEKKEKVEKAPPNLDNDYDPHTNRNLPHPTNDLESLAHILKGVIGTGILAMPEGFSYAGGVMAVIFSFVSGVLCTIGVHILVRGLYMVCKAYRLPVVSYTNAMRLGLNLGPPGFKRYNEILAKITDFFIVFYQCGVICVYILFVSVTLERVTNNLLDKEIPLGFYMLIIVIPCMLINSLKNLKVLVPFSYVSLAVTVLVILLIFYYSFRGGLPPFKETRRYYNDLRKLPMFFGTTAYAFTSVPVVVSVENNMKTPRHFHRIYNVAIAFVLVLYLSIGFFSYWKWGDELQSAVNLNFPRDELLAIMGNYSYALAIFISIGLNGIVPVRLLMDSYISANLTKSAHPVLWEYVLRIGLITLCRRNLAGELIKYYGFYVSVFMAITIPLIGELISLLGAIALSHMAFVFPCLLDACWRYQKGYGKFRFRLIIDVLMGVWGFVGLSTGVYVNVREILRKLSKFRF